MHRLGVISIPYTESVGYDLVRVILSAYLEGHIWWQRYRITLEDKALSDEAIESVLEYVFCLNEESDRFIVRDAMSDDEVDYGMEDITWEQPRHNAKELLLLLSGYIDTIDDMATDMVNDDGQGRQCRNYARHIWRYGRGHRRGDRSRNQ